MTLYPIPSPALDFALGGAIAFVVIWLAARLTLRGLVGWLVRRAALSGLALALFHAARALL